MTEVSAQIMAQLLDGASRFGISAHRLAAEMAEDPRWLRNTRQRISWDTTVDLHEALQRLGMTLPDFEALGAAIPHMPSAGFLVRLTRSVVGLRQLVMAGTRWLAPSLYPIVQTSSRELGDGQLEVILQIPAHRRCAAFLHINKGLVATQSD